VLIGLDGLEWRVVHEMLRAGRMPALADLMERGAYGLLEPTKPTLSPIIWTSIATGMTAKAHGILGFVHEGRDGSPGALYTSRDRRVKALWDIASGEGLHSITIGWWDTFPVDPVNGTMVAQVNTITPAMRRAGTGIWKGQLVEGLTGQVYPPERAPWVFGLVHETERDMDSHVREVFGERERSWSPTARSLLDQSEWALRADAIYARIGVATLAERPPPRLFMIYFGGADVVGHRFWRYAYPESFQARPSEAERAALGDVIRSYYAYLDGVIGELVEAAPVDSTIVVLSDHGMRPVNRRASFTQPLLSGGHLGAPAALIVAAGAHVARAGTSKAALADPRAIGSILDVTPTVLALLDLPVGEDMNGQVLRPLLSEQYLAERPPRRGPPYTDAEWLGSRKTSAAAHVDAVERLEQLRSLGYLE